MYSIPNPCHENWDKMTPDEKGRFCAVCQKTVVNFEQKSTQEALLLLAQEKSLCARISQYQLNTLNRKLKALQYLKQIGVLSSTALLMSSVSPSTQPTTPTSTLRTDTTLSLFFDLTDILAYIPLRERTSSSKYVIPVKNLTPVLAFDKMPPENLAFLYGQYIEDFLVAHYQQDTIAIKEYQTAFIAIETQLNLSFPMLNTQIATLLQQKKYKDISAEVLTIQNEKLKAFEKYWGNKYILYVIIGYFVESLHTAILEHENQPTETTKSNIGEYKLAIETIYFMFDLIKFPSDLKKTALYKDLILLRNFYDKLEIKTLQGDVAIFNTTDSSYVISKPSCSIKVTNSHFQEILKAAKLFVATHRIVK